MSLNVIKVYKKNIDLFLTFNLKTDKLTGNE